MSTEAVKDAIKELTRGQEHIQSLLYGMVTSDGNFILSTPSNMTLKQMRTLRNMLNDRIREHREEEEEARSGQNT